MYIYTYVEGLRQEVAGLCQVAGRQLHPGELWEVQGSLINIYIYIERERYTYTHILYIYVYIEREREISMYLINIMQYTLLNYDDI